jgi:hypothetical protein
MNLSEDRLQADCYQWFHNTYPDLRGLLWHVPNGGVRNASEANKLKAMGVVPGVADLHFFYKGNLNIFELKTEKGRLSPAQELWLAKIEYQGATVSIIRDFDSFQLAIKNIITSCH